LQVSIRDPAGLTTTSSVGVTAVQTLTGIAVAPSSVSVATGATQQFSAVGQDQFGAALTSQPPIGWTVNGGGTISSNGLFTAGTSAGGPFTVTGVSGALAGTASVSVTSGQALLLRINAGGGAAAPFSADQYASGGSTYSAGNAVSTAGVTSPAPAAVYQSERYGNFAYTIGGLAAGSAYAVRLHFAEIYWTAAGRRVFNVSINGAAALSSFDIYAVAGANQAVVRTFAANADSSGGITVQLTTVVDNAKISGIEILTP
jgi:hypothetical protein